MAHIAAHLYITNMKKNISLILGVLAATALLTLLLDFNIRPSIEQKEDATESNPESMKIATDFSFADINDRKARLTDFRGKIVILHFWATWCPPCIDEFPKLAAMADEMKNDVVVLALSSDTSEKNIRQFIGETKKMPNFYTIWDKDRLVTHDVYQTFSYPETIIIDRNGAMIRKIAGDADWTSAEMMSYLYGISK